MNIKKDMVSPERINRNAILLEVVKNICENCKVCKIQAVDINDNRKSVRIEAQYCLNGSGYIEINMYDENYQYLDSCKLKHKTDPCLLPFDLEITNQPDCKCD